MPGHLPSEIRLQKNLLIQMSDGVNLAADLFLPEGDGPFPTLVSYYPYHKDDLIGSMLDFPCRYFAGHGYAHLLVDLRGLGSSEGIAWEAIDPRENKDGAEVVEWAASQPWCDGNVGMWGISYGGVTALQAASEQPPHLKAIVPIYASVDVYSDLIYPGGCLNCLSAFGTWGSFMTAMNLMPPGYQDPEGRWYRVWKERLEKGQPHIFPWQDHRSHDEYWQSRIIPVDKIKAATFVIGGWRDIFPKTAPGLYEKLAAPKKLVMGPWTHIAPDVAPVEPWDYLYQMVRWWDYWLKGQKNGVMDEPPVTLFVQGADIWKYEDEWPPARTDAQTLSLSAERSLSENSLQEEGNDTYKCVATMGAMAGLWDIISLGIGQPLEQGPDDLRSLTYTGGPLPEDIEITGSPEALLHVAVESGEEVNLVAKLTHVGPDGSSSLITTGWLKGSHHSSHEQPEPLEPGRIYAFRIPLWATSYLVPKGHRLRLSVSCADFPRIWPTPTNPQIHLFWGGDKPSHLKIPVVPPPDEDASGPDMRRPDPTLNRMPFALDFAPRWNIEQDLVNGTLSVSTGDMHKGLIPSGGRFLVDHVARATVAERAPAGAKVEGKTTVRIELPIAGNVDVETQTLITRTGMLVTGKVIVDGVVFFEKKWQT